MENDSGQWFDRPVNPMVVSPLKGEFWTAIIRHHNYFKPNKKLIMNHGESWWFWKNMMLHEPEIILGTILIILTTIPVTSRREIVIKSIQIYF